VVTGHDAGIDADVPSDAAGATDALPQGLAVASFTLIDTSITGITSGAAVAGYDPIVDGSTISLAAVGVQLSVRANVGAVTPGSVGFTYNGNAHTENATPYMLCGDNGAGVITDCALTAGTYTITATPYTLAALAGTAGTPLTITFTLTQ
jgi:hypothetical protein